MYSLRRMFAHALVVSSAVPGMAFAQAVPEQSSTAAAPALAPATVRVQTGTEIQFHILTEINSKTAKIDDMFPIRLAVPIKVNGVIMVPIGTPGQGQIVHAAKAGWGGKPGELIVAVRYLEYNGQRIPLRRFRLGPGGDNGGAGDNRTGESTAALAVGGMVAVPIVFMISGGEKIIPNGTLANAIVSADTDIPAAQAPAGAPPAAGPATNATPQG
jgi:hypothetical protein